VGDGDRFIIVGGNIVDESVPGEFAFGTVGADLSKTTLHHFCSEAGDDLDL
jgi:hypothetical protein